MPQLVANPKEILLLAKGLAEDMKRIHTLNEQLAADVNQLSKTFLDDGFEELNDYVTKIQAAITEREENILLIVQQLVAYAEALRKTK